MRAPMSRHAPRRESPTSRADASPAGFSMVELLIVLVVLGILAGIMLPKLNLAQYRLDTAIRLASTTLRRAQRLAITRQYDIVVSFDVPNNSFRVLEDANNNAQVDGGELVEWRVLEDGIRFAVPPVGLNGAVPAAVVGPEVRPVNGLPSVIFHRDGGVSSDLEVYLAAGPSSDEDFRAMSVLQATGRTEWFRLLDSGWKPGGL